MSSGTFVQTLRIRERITHPLAPAVAVVLAAGVLGVSLAAGAPAAPVVACGWLMLALAAGYAVSGSP